MLKGLLLFLLLSVPAFAKDAQMANNVAGILTGIGGTPATPPVVCNSSSSLTVLASTSLVINFPSCSAVGGLVIMNVASSSPVTYPSGWTVLDQHISPGPNIYGASFSRILTSGDISTGHFTALTYGSFVSAVVSLAVFSGSTGPIREVTSRMQVSVSSPFTDTLGTSQGVASSDLGVFFGGCICTSVPTINQGTLLTTASGGTGNTTTGAVYAGSPGTGPYNVGVTYTSISPINAYTTVVIVESAGASQPGLIQQVEGLALVGSTPQYGTATIVMTTPVLAGDTLLTACSGWNTGATLGISDTLGTSFTTLYSSSGGNEPFYVWANYSSAGGADTVTVTGAIDNFAVCVVTELTGVTGIDGSATAFYNNTPTGATSNPQVLGAVTTTTTIPAHVDLLYTVYTDFHSSSQNNSVVGYAVGAYHLGGFSGQMINVGLAYPVPSGGATYSASWVNLASGSYGYHGALIAFKYVP